jgi:hypothetical protein
VDLAGVTAADIKLRGLSHRRKAFAAATLFWQTPGVSG